MGVRIRHLMIAFWLSGCMFSFNNCIVGIEKAAVFPVPVWAQPNISLPAKMAGMDCCCIGVGFLYPT